MTLSTVIKESLDLILQQGDDASDDDEDIISRLSKMGKSEVAEAMAYHDEMMEEYNKRKAEKMTGKLCDVCDTPLYSDPGIHELGIYLHAKRYACDEGNWDYETPWPEWAMEGSLKQVDIRNAGDVESDTMKSFADSSKQIVVMPG